MSTIVVYSIPVNISTSHQRCFNIVDQLWNNVDPMLKMKENPTSDFQCWYNFILSLLQRVLNISKSYFKNSRASDK